MSDLLTLLRIGIDVKLTKEQAQQAADLIESQQQRIAELERREAKLLEACRQNAEQAKAWSTTVERLRTGNAELAADIEKLESLAKEWLAQFPHMGLQKFISNRTPTTSLNAVRREVARKAYIDGSDCGDVDEYINQHYSDKE